MHTATNTKEKLTNYKIQAPYKIAQEILKEIRLLRNEIALLFPQDDIEEYEHSDRIKKNYERAIKKYPIV